MATKAFNEMKNLSKDELPGKIRELESNLFQAKMKLVTGQLADTSSAWRMRKQLARAKTLLAAAAGAQKGSR
jgi:ribosomal protein L29